MAKNYVDKELLRLELIISNVKGELTPKALEMLLLMVTKIQSSFKYVDDQDREDCASNAIEVVLKNWSKYDPERFNAFAYFTRMIYNGLFAGWNELTKHRAEHSISTIFTEST